MKKIYTYLIAFALIGVISFALSVKAGPQYFQNFFASGATATTTVSFLNPQAPSGTVATSTVYLTPDIYTNIGFDSASILVQFSGSSTASVLAVQPEYAADIIGVNCAVTPNACDWYGMSATSTAPNMLQSFTDGRWFWNYASTTPYGGVSGANLRNNRIFSFPTPTKYTRVLLYMVPGSQNGTVWSVGVSKKQIGN